MAYNHDPPRYIPTYTVDAPATRSASPAPRNDSHLRAATGMQARPASHGSRTQVIAPDEAPAGHGSGGDDVVGVLKLRGARLGTGRKVKWVNGVVDNEGMGRKKSKICCIYHKPRAFDESSSSSSSSSSSESDAPVNGPPRIQKVAKRRGSNSSASDSPDGPAGESRVKGKGKAKEAADDGTAERDADGFVIVRKVRRSGRAAVNGSSSGSDTESSSDGGLGDGSARPTRKHKHRHFAHNHAHPRTSDCEADEAHDGHTHGHAHKHRHRHKRGAGSSGDGKTVHPNAINGLDKAKVKPNKYEVQP